MIKVIAFDFDGVLANSVQIKGKVFQNLFSSFGEGVADKAYDFHLSNKGMLRRNKIKKFFMEVLHSDPTPAEIDEKVVQFSKMVVSKVSNAAWIHGAKDFLFSNPSQKIYLISATPKEELFTILGKRKMMHFFQRVYGIPFKKIDAIADILKRGKYEPCEVLFMGDSKSDYFAAQGNGVHFFGIVPNGETDPFPSDIPKGPDLRNLQSIINSFE